MFALKMEASRMRLNETSLLPTPPPPLASTNAVVQNAINARMARNAARRTFGKVVAVADDPFEDSSIFIGGGLSHRAEGSTREKCLANAKALLSEYEAVVSQLKSAIAWMQSQK